MRPPGIVIQLDELEYLLPGLYPGVALAIEGNFLRVLKDDSMTALPQGRPLRENDWTNPRFSSSLQNLLEAYWLPLSV